MRLSNTHPTRQLQVVVEVEHGGLTLAFQEGEPREWKLSDGQKITILEKVEEAEIVLHTADELEDIATRLLKIAQDSRDTPTEFTPRWAFALSKPEIRKRTVKKINKS